MTTADKLQALLDYYNRTRRAGHTRTLLDGVRHSSCVVMAGTPKDAALLAHDAAPGVRHYPVAYAGFTGQAMLGLGLPLAVDNGAMAHMLTDALRTIATLQQEVDWLRAGKPTARDLLTPRAIGLPSLPMLFGSVSELCSVLQEETS